MAIAEKISGGVSRRALLTGGLAGGFLLAFHLPVRAVNEPVQPPDATAGKFAPNAFIRIDEAGQTTLVMPQVEMGQGVYTALPMILAEELDADFAPGRGSSMRRRATSSTAIRFSAFRPQAIPIRFGRGGSRCAPRAPARAPCWCRPPQRNGRSNLQAARRQRARSSTPRADAGFPMANWRLRRAARRRQRTSPLKDPKDFILIGKPLKRLDTPDKVNGKAVYGIDAMLPDMKFATLAAVSGVRRQGRARSTTALPRKFPACGRSSCSTIWSPWSAITCGRPRKASTRW